MLFNFRYIVETPIYPRIIAKAAESIAGSVLGKKGGRWKVESGARGLLFSFSDQGDLLRFVGAWNGATGGTSHRTAAR